MTATQRFLTATGTTLVLLESDMVSDDRPRVRGRINENLVYRAIQQAEAETNRVCADYLPPGDLGPEEYRAALDYYDGMWNEEFHRRMDELLSAAGERSGSVWFVAQLG